MVLQKALEVWDLQVIPLDSPAAGSCLFDPELETAFICHLQDHWFCIRKVNGEWYNFNSLYPAPEHLSKFYLSAFIDTLKGSGWSIFAVRGNFPKECPMATEGSNGFGQWLTPDDARRITASCNQVQTPTQQADVSLVGDQSEEMSEMDMIAAQQEEADLNAAIAASLMDTGGPFTSYGAVHGESRSQDAFASESVSGEISKDSNLERQGANKSEPSEPCSDNCVVKETLRLHPPIPLLHENVEDCVGGGYSVPRGSRVMINVWAIGRDRGAWKDDTDVFRPSRFTPAGDAAGLDFKGGCFEFLPFGSGRRSCSGMALGLYTLELAVAQLAHGFNWALPDGMKSSELDMSDIFGLTAPRATRLFAVPMPRLTCPLY
ncbi:hypothetical protein GUJ93_ZPchr0001g30776 [Zizania palustris]|uniref:ubiquitinyl hydrolase 1 n=1 Tax=Zizania palustris TaxID=103762 RepID=A0A8J5RWL6_ZIZPA|nr:hypothetical protein GUJ93_ZPchr0001g30776 [Zizania palustris]